MEINLEEKPFIKVEHYKGSYKKDEFTLHAKGKTPLLIIWKSKIPRESFDVEKEIFNLFKKRNDNSK